MYTLFDSIEKVPGYDEVNKMDLATGNKLIVSLKQKFTVKELAKRWGVSAYTIYNHLFPKFSIETRSKYKKKSEKQNTTNFPLSITETIRIEKQVQEMGQAAVVVKNGVEEIISRLRDEAVDGFNIRLKGMFNGKYLQERLLSIGSMLQVTGKYDIRLEIYEKSNNSEG